MSVPSLHRECADSDIFPVFSASLFIFTYIIPGSHTCSHLVESFHLVPILSSCIYTYNALHMSCLDGVTTQLTFIHTCIYVYVHVYISMCTPISMSNTVHIRLIIQNMYIMYNTTYVIDIWWSLSISYQSSHLSTCKWTWANLYAHVYVRTMQTHI